MRTFRHDYGADGYRLLSDTGSEHVYDALFGTVLYYKGNPPRYALLRNTDEQIVSHVTSNLNVEVIWC